jgi:hypothetical protein
MLCALLQTRVLFILTAIPQPIGHCFGRIQDAKMSAQLGYLISQHFRLSGRSYLTTLWHTEKRRPKFKL